jgi:transcriptional regulator with XRE-family HTH domain
MVNQMGADMVVTFGDWIKAKREARGMSQTELARLSEPCSQGYISNLERNSYERRDEMSNQPNKDLVIRIAQALQSSETEALEAAGYIVHHPELNANQLRAADLIILLPKDRQEELIREMELKVQMYGHGGGGSGAPSVKPGDELWRQPIGTTAQKHRKGKKAGKNTVRRPQSSDRRTA